MPELVRRYRLFDMAERLFAPLMPCPPQDRDQDQGGQQATDGNRAATPGSFTKGIGTSDFHDKAVRLRL